MLEHVLTYLLPFPFLRVYTYIDLMAFNLYNKNAQCLDVDDKNLNRSLTACPLTGRNIEKWRI